MRALWLVPALAVTLTACSGAPRDELRGDVEAVTLAANDGSAQGVRDAVQALLSTMRAQVANGDLDRAKAERLRELALRIEREAGLLEPAPPSPPPSPIDEPEPTQEPSLEPEPSPEPEPTQDEPEPEPTEDEPEPEQTVEVVVPPVEESPPAQSQGGSGGTSGTPQASPAT